MYISIQYDWQLRLAMCWEFTILVTVAVKRHHDQAKATLIKENMRGLERWLNG